jgi:REP element-mobilizing transposase RayT
MLYATRLAEGMVLALVFDAETPFSTIRTQASQLVHSLSTSPSEESQYENMSGSETNPNSLSTILPGNPALHPLTDIPSGSGYDLGASGPGSRKEPSQAIPLPSAGLSHFNRDSSPAARLKSLIETDQTQSPSAPHGDSIPGSSKEIARKIVLEPASPAFYNIDYACLLVPRFPQHHMTGDLLDRLGEWMLQICIAYGWRLEDISVQPEYLQWIINVPPAASPDHLMRILRQHTSDKIFTEFPRFKKENPSGEFWAPGYLIMGGSQPPPVQLIKDFIAQTRQRQGIHQQIRQ